jgi:uncharacterized protein involved in cysteine biosynthesis
MKDQILKTYYAVLRQRVIIAIMVAFVIVGTSFAQVEINIPIDTFFSGAQTWIDALSPIYSIAVGISLAVAILGAVTFLIVKAFDRIKSSA